MLVNTLSMIGPSATPPASPAEQHPLRAALALGDRLLARNVDALETQLLAEDRALLSEAIVFQVQGMIAALARELIGPLPQAKAASFDNLGAKLIHEQAIRAHCHAIALEWRLSRYLEATIALDPVLSPTLRERVGDPDQSKASAAMAVLSAQSRFTQSQRRMELALTELPAELFHLAIVLTREVAGEYGTEIARSREASLRSDYNEATGRLALQARLTSLLGQDSAALLDVRHAGVGLWLTALSLKTGETREQIAFSTVEPLIGRLLLTLRAAGASPAEAEAQALIVQPDALLPRGLDEIGTREAAQWLADARMERHL